eukprot:1574577-Rhodomonas_salina.1
MCKPYVTALLPGSSDRLKCCGLVIRGGTEAVGGGGGRQAGKQGGMVFGRCCALRHPRRKERREGWCNHLAAILHDVDACCRKRTCLNCIPCQAREVQRRNFLSRQIFHFNQVGSIIFDSNHSYENAGLAD